MKPLMIFVVAISLISMFSCSSDAPKADAAVDKGVADVVVVDAPVDVAEGSETAVDVGGADEVVTDGSDDGEVADAVKDMPPSE
jgi:hypothetical protein